MVLGWITVELMLRPAAHPHSAQSSILTLLLLQKTHKHLPPNNTDSLYLIHSYHGGSLTQTSWDKNEVLAGVCEL